MYARAKTPACSLEDPAAARSSLIRRLHRWEDDGGWQEFFDTYWKLIYTVAIKAGLTDTRFIRRQAFYDDRPFERELAASSVSSRSRAATKASSTSSTSDAARTASTT